MLLSRHHLSEWCLDNNMSFNISKSCLQQFHNGAKTAVTAKYSANNTTLTSLDHYRDLSFIFSTDLLWTKHYNTYIKSIPNTRPHSSFLFFFFPHSIKRLFFISLVRSKLTYCSPVWRPHHSKDITLLEQIQ